jgi:hypothetical protein
MKNEKTIRALKVFCIISFLLDLTIIGLFFGIPLFLICWIVQYIFIGEANPFFTLRCEFEKSQKLFRFLQIIHNLFYLIFSIIVIGAIAILAFRFFQANSQDIILSEQKELKTDFITFIFPKDTPTHTKVSYAFYDAFMADHDFYNYPRHEDYYFFYFIYEKYLKKLNTLLMKDNLNIYCKINYTQNIIECEDVSKEAFNEVNFIDCVRKYTNNDDLKISINKAGLEYIQNINRFDYLETKLNQRGLLFYEENVLSTIGVLAFYIISLAVLGKVLFGRWHLGVLSKRIYTNKEQ